MPLDFPGSPVFGQVYPNPEVPGQPVYTWDNEKWVSSYIDAGGGIMPTAPFHALAYNGMQINGNMEIAQQFGGVTQSMMNDGTAQYFLDGWLSRRYGAGGSASNYREVASGLGGYFSYALGIKAVSAVSVLAGDYNMLAQRIEGYRVARLGWGTALALPITISFWIKSYAAAGHATLSVSNGALTRCYVADINVTTTWQYVTIVIPGDTTGTWLKDSGIGMQVGFASQVGTSFRTTANVWTAGSFIGTSAQTNMMATGNGIQITGVIILPGNSGPTAQESALIMRPTDQELSICQRYLEWCPYHVRSIAYGNNEWYTFPIRFAADKRVVPTLLPAVADPAVTPITTGPMSLTGGTSPSYYGCSLLVQSSGAGAFEKFGYRFLADARP